MLRNRASGRKSPIFGVRPEIADFWGLGCPGDPKNPFQKVGGFDPHLLECFFGPPGPPRPQQSTISGPELGLPGRVLVAVRENTEIRLRAGRTADVGAFPVAVRPKSGPEGRFTARKQYYVTRSHFGSSLLGLGLCSLLGSRLRRGGAPAPVAAVRSPMACGLCSSTSASTELALRKPW